MIEDFFIELKIFSSHIIDWVFLYMCVVLFFFVFGAHTLVVFGYPLVVPWVEGVSFAASVLDIMVRDLIPSTVSLIVTAPLSAFGAQVKVALLLSFIVTLPVALFSIAGYFAPAMYERERRAVRRVVLPSAVLFALGAWFAYRIIIPPTVAILYGYADTLGVISYLTLDAFIGFVLALMVGTGIMFLVPVVMVLLARTGLVSTAFWIAHWRGAVVTFLVLSAIITPDGSGITMLLLSAPMAGLYGVGLVASRTVGERNGEYDE